MDFREAWPHAQSSLSAAIRSGDKARFDELLANNCEVDVADNRGWRPLHVAAAQDQHSFVRHLLQREGTDVNWRTFEGETALWLATERGHKQTCQILLQRAARHNIANNENQYPLHIGVTNRHTDCVRLLLRNGAQIDAVDFDGRSALHEAACLGHVPTVRLLLKSGAQVDLADCNGATPLFLAATSGDLRCVKAIRKQLGSRGVDASTLDGTTPLMMAAQHGRLDCMSYLLDEGADARHAACDGALAIHLATQSGNLSCVKILMPLTGADALLRACYGTQTTADPDWLPTLRDTLASADRHLDLPNHGISVLHLAVDWNRIEILGYLLKNGVDPNVYIIKDLYDTEIPLWCTALGLACRKCSEEAVNALVDAGAQFRLCNACVSDPLHCALNSPECSREFLRFLVARGADLLTHLRSNGRFSFIFTRPDLLLEWMALGGWCNDYRVDLELAIIQAYLDCQFGDCLVRPYQAATALMDVMFVLIRFLPAANMRWLHDAVNPIIVIDELDLQGRWRRLWEIMVAPRTLLEQCRNKIRKVLMARVGYDLQRDIPKLDMPETLKDYLLFRER